MKNKKILGALAALCMGVILCVSSVFAVNYWYTINNNGNEDKVTMGNALKLELSDATADDHKHLYPGGYVTFEDITVSGADAWLDPAASGVVNVELPKFALRVGKIVAKYKNGTELADEALATFIGYFTAYQNEVVDATAYAATMGTNNVMAENMIVLDDLQTIAGGADIEFNLRLAFNANADAAYAECSFAFELEIVAYLDANGNNKLDAGETVLNGDAEQPDNDQDFTDGDTDNDTLDPTGGAAAKDPTEA